MTPIFCSTGALLGRPNGRNIHLLSCANEIRCDGFEFMMYDTWYDKLDEIEEFMSEFRYPTPIFHIDKQVGELISQDIGNIKSALEIFKINCCLAKKIGSEKLVLHLWGGLSSDKHIEQNISAYPLFKEISDSFGLILTIENVVCNCHDPMSNLKMLAEKYPDILFTFDTKMAAFHNQLDELYKEENIPIFRRISHLHMNDYSGGYMDWSNLRTLHIGKGSVDFDKLFRFLNEHKYSGSITIEATSFDKSGKIHIDDMNNSLDILRAK